MLVSCDAPLTETSLRTLLMKTVEKWPACRGIWTHILRTKFLSLLCRIFSWSKVESIKGLNSKICSKLPFVTSLTTWFGATFFDFPVAGLLFTPHCKEQRHFGLLPFDEFALTQPKKLIEFSKVDQFEFDQSTSDLLEWSIFFPLKRISEFSIRPFQSKKKFIRTF